jgi:hypothetical protein
MELGWEVVMVDIKIDTAVVVGGEAAIRGRGCVGRCAVTVPRSRIRSQLPSSLS